MEKFNNIVLKLCEILIMTMIPAMTLVVFAQVVMRYVFKSPFIWAEELARYLLVWISCLGAAYGIRKGMHIAVQFLYDKFNQTARSTATLFIHLLVIMFFLVGIIAGVEIALAQWNQISPGLRIPMTWAYLSVPAGFVVMLMFSFEQLIIDASRIFFKKDHT